jgi:hypothetical protein
LKRKYGQDSKALVMLLVVRENNTQGRTIMLEDGIMDTRRRQFKSNGTDAKEVASAKWKSNRNIIVFLLNNSNGGKSTPGI